MAVEPFVPRDYLPGELWTAEKVEDLESRLGVYAQEAVEAVASDVAVIKEAPLNVETVAGADFAARTQSAIDTAVAVTTDYAHSGVGIFIPPGSHDVDRPITGKAGVDIAGAGKKNTVLRRTGNFMLFDLSGTADDPSTGMLLNVNISDLELNSLTRGIGTFTAPLVRLYYSQFVHWHRVNFRRAGCSAIAAVRYYDGEFHNCRWDFCGATGYPVIHLMCSEQGKTVGQFGYSTDSCNNIYFLNSTWESNPGTEVHLDGRQSDGTYNFSRRINMCRFTGAKMESGQTAERSPTDARLIFDNTSHAGIYDLLVSARGVADGATPTNWVVMKNCFNLVMPRLTVVANEPTVPHQAIRAGLSMQGGNVGCKIGQVCGAVQATNRPSVALVEFTGTNDVAIDNAYYDNNPSSAPKYAGQPTTWIGGDEEQQAIVPGWSGKMLVMATRALTALTAYEVRYVPKMPRLVTGIRYLVTTAASTDQPIDVGVYAANGTTRLASSGAVSGKLNALGWQTVTFTTPLQLDPGVTYFINMSGGTPPSAGTVATVYGLANAGSSTAAHQANGTAPPGVEYTSAVTSHPLPNPLTGLNSGLSSVPAPYLV